MQNGPHRHEAQHEGSRSDSALQRMAVSAVAAGVAATGAGDANASIIHVTFDQAVDDSAFDVDLDGDGHSDFVFSHTSRSWDPGGYNGSAFEQDLDFNGADPANRVLLTDDYQPPWRYSVAAKLTLGDEISATPSIGAFGTFDGRLAGDYFYYVGGYCGYGCYGGTIDINRSFGFWNGIGSTGFVGFEFDIAGATHYGWAQIMSETSGIGTLIDAGYETVPGQAIQAGVIPEPSTLNLLALGFAGLGAYRSRQIAAVRRSEAGAGNE